MSALPPRGSRFLPQFRPQILADSNWEARAPLLLLAGKKCAWGRWGRLPLSSGAHILPCRGFPHPPTLLESVVPGLTCSGAGLSPRCGLAVCGRSR